MEKVMRSPLQGVGNIIRFNWHFYAAATGFVTLLLTIGFMLGGSQVWLFGGTAAATVVLVFVSLLVSYYVYDASDLYRFGWLRRFNRRNVARIANIHAGFDETSTSLRKSFPDAALAIFDFYDPTKHTEVSIERARRAYAPFEGTIKISTSAVPMKPNSANIIFNIFALHEVRDREERIQFLEAQSAALSEDGNIVVVEHLRDIPNLLAYNIGFFHFFSGHEWRNNFRHAGLIVDRKFKITPFVTVFVLIKSHGNTR